MTNPALSSACLRSSRQIKNISNNMPFTGGIQKHSVATVLRIYSREASSKPSDKPARTSLYDLHLKHGGKMVDFAGYSLPVQYGNVSISESHLHTRSSCSIFDVSHMLQTEITGPDSIELLESVCVTDVKGLGLHKSSLSVFTNEAGGIEDDFVVTKSGEKSLYVVSNAARKKVVSSLLLQAAAKFKANGKTAEVTFLEPEERALLAVQGPKSAQILQPLVSGVDLSSFYFMTSATVSLKDAPSSRITRCGYTGEDGFEVSLDAKVASDFVQSLLEKHPELVRLAGLGARDSLRIEAGLCLYGNEIDSSTTPVEAGLTWTIGKKRRERGDFPGAPKILQQIKEGATKQRVGLIQGSKGLCPRNGCEILTLEKELIGKVTSGCPSPSLKTNVAMGYVAKSFSQPGNQVLIKIRDNITPMTLQKMPFVPAKYFTKPKKK